MKQQQYIKSLDEAFEIYGKENLVAISYIKQQIFYAKFGVQPRFIWEKEDGSGKLTCWYLKSESNVANKEWMKTKTNRLVNAYE